MLDISIIGCGNMGYPLIKQWIEYTEHSFTIITSHNNQTAKSFEACIESAYNRAKEISNS